MRIRPSNHHRRNEEGVAIIMVIVFLVVMAGLISLNGRVLSEFKREVELNERRQERKWSIDSDAVVVRENVPASDGIEIPEGER